MKRTTRLAILCTALLLLFGCNKKDQGQSGSSELLKVDVSAPVEEPIKNYEVFTGRTQAVNYTDIRARVTGYLVDARFKEGQDVKKDDVLFVVDPRPYELALAQAKANFKFQQAQLVFNEADYRRTLDLFQKGAVSEEDLDKSRAARDTQKEQVNSARAAVNTAELNVNFTKVVAPFDGRISRRQVDPGTDILADSTIMASLVQMDPMYAYFDVDERTLLGIRDYLSEILSEGKVPADASKRFPVTLGFANQKTEQFSHSGELMFADNKLDPTTGTMRMWGIFQNPKHDLYSGLFIRVKMEVPPEKSTDGKKWLLVSEAALSSDQGHKYLYVVKETKEDGASHFVVARVDVEVDKRQDGLIAVKNLEGDERIIVSNIQRLRPKMEVADPGRDIEMPRAKTQDKTPPVAPPNGRGEKVAGAK
jgi:RND family efflux transporter MFP subunit